MDSSNEYDEFWADFTDGRKRRMFASTFEEARDVFHAIGRVQSMDYADCLWDPSDPEYLPLQSGQSLGLYDA